MTTDRRRVARIAFVDETAADERHAERLEIAGARAAIAARLRAISDRLGPRAAFDEDERAAALEQQRREVRIARALDAGQRAHALEHASVERVAIRRRPDSATGASAVSATSSPSASKPGSTASTACVAAQQQTRTGEQHDGQRDLARRRAPCATAASLGRARRRLCRMPRRNRAAPRRTPARRRTASTVTSATPIVSASDREIEREPTCSRATCPAATRDSSRSTRPRCTSADDDARRREQQLSVKSCRNTRPRAAPSALRIASSFCRARRAREHQVRDVGARNQQHERDGAEQREASAGRR